MQKLATPQKEAAALAEHKNYLILDAALWNINIEPAFNFDNKHCCLFTTRGAEHELNAVAPYLFEYKDGDKLSNWVKYKVSKGLRMLFLSSALSMKQLRKHLRRFLRVKTEDGRWLLFQQMFFALESSKYFPKLPEAKIYAIIENQTKKLIKYKIKDFNNSRVFIGTRKEAYKV